MLRTNAIPIVDSYDRNTNNYLGSFEQTDENILNYVAGLSPFQSVRLVEHTTDTLILTTIGYFFDQVSDQQWLQQILPKLIAKQTGKKNIEAVKIFFY
ncbi:hypothetical protein EB19_02533 [Enterococcus faecium]|uniref:Uncharacterized protein n=1 Tax=Enterococcus faecium TaxID=1352 RepID=A0A3F3NKH9_ENTFC|nr:hypothetical protein [Enterococcus faecium]PQF86187.1 hypothetical protein CUS59_04915 [Enterococcus faecium]PQG43480.1 hypothetical protein CUS36_12390 [Enterococcus faecium]RBS28237.1 hypothetical protein EB12_02413 [Enterococcus faecium]RBS38171.1 hypothetical protein EB19_02533 [Enterococcus faecium]RBS55039.1 hypothetical protein EB33_02252 [Enterococcus faecium]